MFDRKKRLNKLICWLLNASKKNIKNDSPIDCTDFFVLKSFEHTWGYKENEDRDYLKLIGFFIKKINNQFRLFLDPKKLPIEIQKKITIYRN